MKHYEMKAYWGVEVELHEFLVSTQVEGEWSDSRPRPLLPPIARLFLVGVNTYVFVKTVHACGIVGC
jgi:hypothetical protein